MPIPEPSTAGGLWESVKPVTGWPQTDEDRLAQLAGDWRSGAQRFTTTGGFDLTGLGGIWPDAAGEATGERARGTLTAVMGTADGMTMLANRVDAFAASVRFCKVDIGRIVEANIPGYATARGLPPGLAESDATTIRTSVIEQINDRIGGCVREIGGLGLQPTDLPVNVGTRGGTLGGLLEEEENPTTVADPVPPWAQTGGGPLVQLPGGAPGIAGGPLGGGPGIGPAGEPPAGIIDSANASDEQEPGATVPPVPGSDPEPSPPPQPAPAPEAPLALDDVPENLRPQVEQVVGQMDHDGTLPEGVQRGGSQTGEGIYGGEGLPPQPPRYYVESDIDPTPEGETRPESGRLVFGARGEVWYTGHYDDGFIQLRGPVY